MSVVGYLVPDGRGNGEVGMRKEDGIPKAEDRRVRMRVGRPDGEALPGGLVRAGDEGRFYEDVEDYDPVLRWHCRL